jgi:formylglycine-generating enzyme required for sulfatase activity
MRVLLAGLLSACVVALSPAGEPAQVRVTNSVGMEFVWIKPGTFTMGRPEGELSFNSKEYAAHEVVMDEGYHLGVHEVTQQQYERVIGRNPSWLQAGNRQSLAGVDTRRFPVEGVSWSDAVAFCRALGKLPAERAAGRRYRRPPRRSGSTPAGPAPPPRSTPAPPSRANRPTSTAGSS